MRLAVHLAVLGVIGCNTQVAGFDGSASAEESGQPDPTTTTTATGSSSGSDGGSADGTVGTTMSTTMPGTTVADGSDSSTTDHTVFDVGTGDTETEPDPCSGKGNGVEFSYIWISNSNESTVSKIDTHDMVEVGRYVTRPDAAGNPSRTSVNLNGDVAVANRNGGITMIRARSEDCLDPTSTSTGPNDVKPWQDGCVEWYTPLPYTSQRPVAWTQGTLNEQSCLHDDAMLWTAGAHVEVPNSIEVLLLDGETGVVVDTVAVPDVPNGAFNFGLYGGAVDGDGNFWASQLDVGELVRVKLSDLSVDHWPMPVVGYGMTVDAQGRPWTCNAQVARFDPVAEAWTVGAGEPGPGGAGCMQDANGVMWVAGYSITAIDVDSMDLIAQYPMPVINGDPETGYGRGISIDFEGYVWSPSHWSNAAYRLDPETGEFTSVTGLNFPYTYSDMTGFALTHAGTPAG